MIKPETGARPTLTLTSAGAGPRAAPLEIQPGREAENANSHTKAFERMTRGPILNGGSPRGPAPIINPGGRDHRPNPPQETAWRLEQRAADAEVGDGTGLKSNNPSLKSVGNYLLDARKICF